MSKAPTLSTGVFLRRGTTELDLYDPGECFMGRLHDVLVGPCDVRSLMESLGNDALRTGKGRFIGVVQDGMYLIWRVGK